ncbi:NADP-specific glutamate dehydrogenase [Roseivivax jejudonensis]|uniref:Glutamate dehydrogenase n=1 Tax=Roseivivax jejudonensis TaxID=1529041 RepID=A0A1X6YR16_9RHOB|nr:NADP-specific glutamate dehydrogenase [Roseivivax jejudonensis]SLN28666.1 NADP-specific glutamate dehydrogenase [Roseivivax jejudonensis]
MDRRDALVESFMEAVRARNSGEDEFLQAVEEVARDVLTVEKAHSGYTDARVLERLTEPDLMVQFRVVWEGDDGATQVNRGWRVQMSNAIGPYKGGIRFHPSVSPSVLKFLAFEQCFKNALTGLPLGGAKGGADFDPSGRSPAEIMRFSQAFMAHLAPFIGPDLDVPAGDINVGQREIGWLFGAYKRQQGVFNGALTGKGEAFGGSALRTEATGFGLVYFVCAMLAHRGEEIAGKRIAISGKGNVSTHAALKAIDEGARVVTLSDTSGTLHAPDGFSREGVEWVMERKAAGEDIATPPAALGLQWHEDTLPWGMEADIALPCATQNEMDEDAAKALVDGGASLLAEGANMPLTSSAISVLDRAGLLQGPGKAANAGGVAVSGLEMSQNAQGRFLTREDVDRNLRDIMSDIHRTVLDEAGSADAPDYRQGANVAGYRHLARAIASYGII